MEQREAFLFYRSYFEAIKQLEPVDQRLALMAICSYALDGEEMPLSGVPAAVFMLTKPNLDTSKKRAESGKVGGKAQPNAKQNASKTEANSEQNASKTEANAKQTPSKAEAIKDKGYRIKDKGQGIKDKGQGIKDKGEGIDAHTTKEPKVQWADNVTMTNAEHEKLLATHGPADTARLIEILDNYKGSSGKAYKDDYRAILSWCVDRLNEEKANARKPSGINAPPSMNYDGGRVQKDMERLDRLLGGDHGS